MGQNAMVMATRLLYSPVLASSDFYLFGPVKNLPTGKSFETGDQVLSAVKDFVLSLEKWTLTMVFLEWMTRPERSIEINGDYVG
jgi:hypothetical protein